MKLYTWDRPSGVIRKLPMLGVGSAGTTSLKSRRCPALGSTRQTFRTFVTADDVDRPSVRGPDVASPVHLPHPSRAEGRNHLVGAQARARRKCHESGAILARPARQLSGGGRFSRRAGRGCARRGGREKHPGAVADLEGRFRRPASEETPSGRTLTATSRPRRSSRARQTSPIPPAPSGATTSCGPTGFSRRSPSQSKIIGVPRSRTGWRRPADGCRRRTGRPA